MCVHVHWSAPGPPELSFTLSGTPVETNRPKLCFENFWDGANEPVLTNRLLTLDLWATGKARRRSDITQNNPIKAHCSSIQGFGWPCLLLSLTHLLCIFLNAFSYANLDFLTAPKLVKQRYKTFTCNNPFKPKHQNCGHPEGRARTREEREEEKAKRERNRRLCTWCFRVIEMPLILKESQSWLGLIFLLYWRILYWNKSGWDYSKKYVRGANWDEKLNLLDKLVLL